MYNSSKKEVLDTFISHLDQFNSFYITSLSTVVGKPWHWAIPPVLQLLLPFSPLALAPLHQTGDVCTKAEGQCSYPHGSASPCVPDICIVHVST